MPTGCRQMKVDWPWQSTPFAYAASVDVRPDGQAVLDLVRLARGGPDEWRMKVVAEADGKVLSAMVDPRGHDEVNHDGGTFLFKTQRSLAEQAVVYYVPDADLADFYPMAVVGGAADELHPKVQWVWNHTAGAWLAATGKLWASSDGVRIGVAKWGEPWQQIFHGSEAGGLQQTTVNPFHDLVTWESSNGIYTGLMAWTPERGPYPFITYPGDHSRGAWGLGTDGVDMVWTYSKGKGPDIVPYPAGSVMTSPFTTDPAQLVPRRLRSYPSPHVAPVVPWEVGCGHAAIEWDTDKVLVVRLSDGWSWEMPVSKDGPFFSTVYAVSCDEIFLRASPMDAMNIARVKLDALGPGMPPD
jgi:hypothetical protein